MLCDKALYTRISLYDSEKNDGSADSIFSDFMRSFWIAFFVLTAVFFVILPAAIVVIVLSVTRGKSCKTADKPDNARRVASNPDCTDSKLRVDDEFRNLQTTATKTDEEDDVDSSR